MPSRQFSTTILAGSWPQTDPSHCHTLAQAQHGKAVDLLGNADDVRGAADQLIAKQSGATVEAFHTTSQELAATMAGHADTYFLMSRASTESGRILSGLREDLDRIDYQAHQQIDQILRSATGPTAAIARAEAIQIIVAARAEAAAASTVAAAAITAQGTQFGIAPPTTKRGAGAHSVDYTVKASPPTPEVDRKKNQIEAFEKLFGRAPISRTDWETAAALDPHSYDPKNQGALPNVVVGRIRPVPGQGVVRTNLFIPSKDVWDPKVGWPPYANNLGDNRGFDPNAGPEESRVTISTDFENGIIVARQNPSVNADTNQVRTGTPDISAVQQANGSVLIQYNAADPFSPGGETPAKLSGISVNGTLGIATGPNGPRIGGENITTFPAIEVYGDRAGATTPLLQSWPSFYDNAAGPLTGLPFNKNLGDPSVVPSFNSVVPQSGPLPNPMHGPASMPLTPPMSIVPPSNFTPFGPATAAEAPTIRNYTPFQGGEFLPHR